MAAVSCFSELFRLVNNSAVWLEKREYLLLPRFSLISDFALCDNRACVLCHHFAEGSRQEASETGTKVLGTVARCRRLWALAISWGVRAMGRQEQRSDIFLSCQEKESLLPLRAPPTAPYGIPQGCSEGYSGKIHTGSV